MRRFILFFFCCFLCWGGMSYDLSAQEQTSPKNIKAGVYISPPFVMDNGGGSFYGMAIDLWETIEQHLNLRTEYIQFHVFEELVKAAETGKVDIAITNITVTYERARYLKFSYPWYDSGMRIMVKNDTKGSVFDEMKRNGQLQSYGWLFLLLVSLTVVLTFIRRRLDSDFPKKWIEGLTFCFYDLLVAAKSGRINHKYLGWFGYILSSVWMIFGVALVAYVTSTVTSSMTTLSLTREINSVHDLDGRKVAVLKGSVAQQYLGKMSLGSVSFNEIDDAAQALLSGQVQAVVADAPVLEYWVNTHPEMNLDVVGELFHKDKYAFASSKKQKDLMDSISVELIRLYEQEKIRMIKEMYFGSQTVK